MPVVKVNDIHIYYEIHGEGEALVFIGGLANDITDYTDHTRIISELSQKYQVIVFDNRGAGRTDKPDIPYSIEMMANDTKELLKALGIKQAHIIGISMGGRIALELALQRPEMVKKLVLVSTSARVIKTWRRHLFFNVLPRIPIFKGRYPQPYYAFARQREASSSYNCTDRLSELHIPTIIMHGKKDKSAPYKLAEEMHALIPDAKIITFNGGHLFLFLKQEDF
jgi:3-oxoadipate enol-lactonase